MWCYIVLWVVLRSALLSVRWSKLKDHLQSICPPCTTSYYFNYQPPRTPPVYLLKFCCLDRKGLLHDVTQVLCELDLMIQRVKVTTTPDGKVLDLFFTTDNLELLHTTMLYCRFQTVLRDSCTIWDLQLAGPAYEFHQGISSLPPFPAEELFRCELSENEV